MLDLEHDLGERQPPGLSQKIRQTRVSHHGRVHQVNSSVEVGKALLWTHGLEQNGCQCRHNLDTEARIARGVSGNSERSGKCPLTLKIDAGKLTNFGMPMSRISMAGRGMLDVDVPNLVKSLRSNSILTELCLQGNSISNTGARHLAKFIAEDNRTLTDLDLGNNKIGDTGAIALADALSENRTLLELSLDGNPIRLEGAQHILSAVAFNPFCHVVLPDYAAVNSIRSEAFEDKTDG
jgi:hypothetical protein